MEFIRKTLKAFAFSLMIFMILTLILALLIQFTSFQEEWAVYGLAACLSIACLILGVSEGIVTGRKGIITGAAAAAVFILIIRFAVCAVFSSMSGITDMSLLYIIPLLTGAAGGVMGSNRSSS